MDGPGSAVAGQNNDEDPAGWLDGALDHVLRYDADAAPDGAPAALIYTHPGYPASLGRRFFFFVYPYYSTGN